MLVVKFRSHFPVDIDCLRLAVIPFCSCFCCIQVLGWSINRGPLSWDLTLSQFICTYNLPITPVNSKPKNSKSNWRSSTKGNSKHGEKGDPPLVALVGLFGKILLLFFATILLTQLKVPLLIIEFFYMFVVYAFFGGLMQLVSVVIPLVCGISVAPHFCKPYFSSSFTDFWSRRWNLNTGYALRFLIYDPICEGKSLMRLIIKTVLL